VTGEVEARQTLQGTVSQWRNNAVRMPKLELNLAGEVLVCLSVS
jgi:hypothetical protein